MGVAQCTAELIEMRSFDDHTRDNGRPRNGWLAKQVTKACDSLLDFSEVSSLDWGPSWNQRIFSEDEDRGDQQGDARRFARRVPRHRDRVRPRRGAGTC